MNLTILLSVSVQKYSTATTTTKIMLRNFCPRYICINMNGKKLNTSGINKWINKIL